MAPEVLKGNCYSAKADIWAIGIVFLEMIIGELPWAGARE
jgi:serine/threonine protein kinase